MKKAHKDIFLTEDLNLAAYLTASGKSRLHGIVGGNSWKKSFKLSPAPSNEEIAAYYAGTAKISALRLCETLRSLKSAVRAELGTSHG